MSSRPIDLRSDTVTRPTAAMRTAMAEAEVGDDVYRDDPTTQRLEARAAELLGKEAALFVPSGTMSNILAVRVHCQPGDELLCEAGCHLFNAEQGAYAQLFGIAARPITGTNGVLELDQLVDCIRPDDEHFPRTRLISLENTHNTGGGRIQPLETLTEICAWAADHGLARHLDGSRIFNAVVGTGIAADLWAAPFDTVNICFSKGLGAPIGSALVGPNELIRAARRQRKALGGSMRQVGIVAAAALFALDHHIDRLAEDHYNAQILAEAIRQSPGLSLEPERVDTNIIIFRVADELGTAEQFCARLHDKGVWITTRTRQTLRAVTHLDVSLDDAKCAAEIVRETAAT